MQFSSVLVLAMATAAYAANKVPQSVHFSSTGVAPVNANGIGCAHITPNGKAAQLGCVLHVFTDGFTVRIKDEKTQSPTVCAISGTSGPCGPAGVVSTVDLTGGTGTAPPPSGPSGTTTLPAAFLTNKAIKRRIDSTYS